jgi:hypothetical protein
MDIQAEEENPFRDSGTVGGFYFRSDDIYCFNAPEQFAS